MGQLGGKTAIVTGAARGGGETISRAFVAEGANVVLLDILDDRGKTVADDLGEAAVYVHCDVTNESEWQDAVATALRQFGSVDTLVNNAAILHLANLVDTTVEDYLRVVKVNEIGPFLGIKTVAGPMKDRGSGSIINISSVDGVFVSPFTAAYAASKFHIRGLGKSAAVELGEFGIRVNTICPAAGNPEMVFDAMPPEIREAFAGVDTSNYADQYPTPPIGRHGQLTDVAKMCVFLASDQSEFMTGADVALDGGATAGFTQKMISGLTGIQIPA
ncbi:MAG: 3-alpha(Or 20-beta)-hydroxysteroid dehydrogenase [Acidimicrobiales bacterium]|jgi:3alpha(or 20beta)-hydroxysteroid dehydrogenase|nr:3-alpha(Or 20-beta)-hydroxysteroid dehydrogenase [Acidimicrobiales bacterium]